MNKQIVGIVAVVLLIGGGALLFTGNNEEMSADAGNQGAGMALADLPPIEEQFDMVYDYCVTCHNETDYTGGLSFEFSVAEFVHEEGDIWERVIRKLNVGQMPPLGEPQPTEEQREMFIATLGNIMDEEARNNPNPGAPVLPRLNRTEYQNAIRDLLHLDIDATAMFPADDSAEGLDNMSTALSFSPTLLEAFVAASGKVATLAVGNPDMPPDFATYRAPADLAQDQHIPGAPIGTQGGVAFEHYFPLDGEYEFSPKIYRGILDDPKGVEFASTLEITIDKERVYAVDFGGYEDTFESGLSSSALSDYLDEKFRSSTFVPAGEHTVTVAFIRKPPAQNAEIWRQFQRTVIDSNVQRGAPHLDKVEIRGPFNPVGTGDTASRQKIFTCDPGVLEDEQQRCANEILSTLAREAFRRPVTENEISDLMNFYALGREIGGFEKGVESGIRRIISGPEFLFRVETAPEGVAQGSIFELNDLDLASRLSFFLWSSIPDEELLETAIAGELSDPAVFEAQVTRMLADPKTADNLTYNFATQWLTLRNLQGIVPDPGLFPDYDDNLRQSSIAETQLLFKSIVDEDRNIFDLINADYTYVNERLATLYGIEGVYGSRMRRVEVLQEERRGVLGHSSIQTLTSLGTRTSPVTRGKWFLDNLIATPPPSPPPDVPALEESEGEEPATLRELMVMHRADPVCSSCHKLMDTIGFAMENFDGVGRYRVEENGMPINSADILFDGTQVDGVNDLREWLRDNEEVFVAATTQKLLQFALARPVEYFDMPTVRQIVREAAADDYSFSSIVMGIVNSVPFRMRINEAEDGNATTSVAALDQ